MDKKTAPYH